MDSTEKYCPFHGYNPPCARCMLALRKDDLLFCSIAWSARKQVRGGLGNDDIRNNHAFAPWIENAAKVERADDALRDS